MTTKKLTTEQAARELAEICDEVLSKLPIEEQRRRVKAFHRMVAKRIRKRP